MKAIGYIEYGRLGMPLISVIQVQITETHEYRPISGYEK
jgi:hypothetical protein